MAFAIRSYEDYCAVASRSWPRLWALRLEIPLAFATFSVPYGMIVYWISYQLLAPKDSYFSRLDLLDGWLTLGGGVMAAIGFVGWSMALSRALPLHCAPLLRWHPNSGILFLISIFFLLIPMASSTVLASGCCSDKLQAWGNLQKGGRLILGPLGLIVLFTGLSMWAACFVIARVGDLQEAVWSVVVLICYAILYIVICFAVLSLERFDQWEPAMIYAGGCLASLGMQKAVWDRWFRLLVLYPTFLASSPGLFVLFTPRDSAGTLLINNYSLTALLLSAVASALVSSLFSWVLRRRPARLAE